MSKAMLINVTHVEESRVAILEDGVLAEYEIETINRTNIKGNIYNAVVDNVHPGLEAAFLKIAPDLKGFLPLDEVNFRLLPERGEGRSRGKIGMHLHPGQKLMVQVIREPFSGKPPTVTTYFSLPGRFLVLMPGVDSSGISRKIDKPEERENLKKIVDELNPPEGFGVIVRTAGLGHSRTELQRDLRYLLRLWEATQRSSKATEFPGLVYQERDLVIRTIRDYLTPDIKEVWIDSKETYERAMNFVRDVMPTRAKTLKLYQGDRPLFGKFNLEDQIESIYKRRVTLKSGGEIVIDGTEALTAVDVNSARSARKKEAEENAVQTNLEAAAEIGRQLRLRDLGGLVVIDFIDMMAARNQKKVEKVVRDVMKADRAKYDITRISKLGLMEIARQRIRGEKMRASYNTCPVCEGYGLLKNVEAAALAALRKLQARCLRTDYGRIRMGLPPDVATWVQNNKREELHALEQRHGIRIMVEPKASLLRHDSEFEFFPRETVEVPPALTAGDRPAPPAPPDLREMEPAKPPEAPAEAAPAEATGDGEETAPAPKKRRRRRRRRRSVEGGDEGAAPDGDAPVGRTEAGPADETPVAGEPAAEEEASEGAAPVEESSNGAPRKRRRRRRRRRGRGGSNGEAGDESDTGNREPSAPASHESDPVPEVPKHVRSEELMPAATGGSRRRGGGRRRGGKAS